MKKLILGGLLTLSCISMADDIELYVGSESQRIGGDPKVLIIFDNSGSMRGTSLGKPAYDPNYDDGAGYPVIGDLNDGGEPAVYFTKGLGLDNTIPIPGGPNERRRFLKDINGCQSSWDILATVGYYTGYFREHKYQGANGTWVAIPDNNGMNIEVIDCYADIDNDNPINAPGVDPGMPVDGLGRNNSPIYYSPLGDAQGGTRPTFNTGELVTLYSEDYLRWAAADVDDIGGAVPQSRLERAQTTITDFIISNPNFDFGLQIFNINHSGENARDGGRIVFGIQDMDLTSKTALLDIINNQLDPETNTPLCESLYEASVYFGGKTVDYGDNDTNIDSYTANTPPRDTSIESGSNYITPFDACTKQIYTILITDGGPTLDNAANDKIAGVEATTYTTVTDGITASVTSHLASLAYYMRTHDLVSGEAATAAEIAANGGAGDFSRIKNSTLSTIAFDFPIGDVAESDPPGAKLLKDAATRGGGQYYNAESSDELRDALKDFAFNISKSHGSFTAPAVATNNFDRTKTLDSIYYAMFQPGEGPRWSGNIKKLKVTDSSIQGQNEGSGIDSEGNISENTITYWTTGDDADGNEVDKGGVAQKLRTKHGVDNERKVLSDVKLGDGGELLALTRANALNTYINTEALALELGVFDDDAHLNIDNMLAWAKGDNVDLVPDDDGTIPEIRYDVFGDPLHSKPMVINYGSEASPDIRIIVGTNAGVLHMFADSGDSVDESWAYMPGEFLKNISGLRSNFPSPTKVYGVDGTPTTYISDDNGNGEIDGDDKVWLFFGLRRGGNSYYALDISDPDDPKFMWNKTYEGAGQSWSQPRVTYSKINIAAEEVKPVLIFGAGYAITKDGPTIGGSDNGVGVGIFMVDAKSGNLIWRLHETSSAITTTFAGTDSIPTKIGILDSDADGFVDRLYAGDTGGNVWRIDMPGTAIAEWSVIKLASLGGFDSNTDDRRFFNQPTIVRALITETIESTLDVYDAETNTTVTTTQIDRYKKPYDAILLGSGDVTNPLGTDTEDKFFMIKDEFIVTQTMTVALTPDVIIKDDLKDYTDNPFQGLAGDALQTEQLLASAKSGWYIDFELGGEKSMSSAAVISGVAYFNSFTPAAPPESGEVCSAEDGGAALYAVDLALGTTIYDNRRIEIGYNPPGEPTFVTIDDPDFVVDPENPDAEPPQILAIIAPDIKPLCTGDACPGSNKFQTNRTYLYTTEE